MELVIRPFRFRDAAAFWGVAHDPELAFRLKALVGGTPAYLEMSGGSGPTSTEGFDRWVQRRLLNPASAMFREGGLLLREEPSIMDPTSYAAILAALSAGNHRRSEIAAPMDTPRLQRLEHLRGLLPGARVGALPKLLLFARAGFTPDLVRLAAGRADVELVDLARLYNGA